MIENRLRKLWDNLQAKRLHMPHFLMGVRLRGIRGIDDIRASLQYPVNVVAGGNASGKSTVRPVLIRCRAQVSRISCYPRCFPIRPLKRI